VPLFDWLGPFQMGWSLGMWLRDELARFEENVEGEHFGVRVTKGYLELARLEAQQWESDRLEVGRLARSRWLEKHRAERSFPCGIVPDPVLEATDPGRAEPKDPPRPLRPSEPGWAAPERPVAAQPPAEPQPLIPLRAMNVMAAVLPDDIAFIREHDDDDQVDEVGRLPREAIREVDVVDVEGNHVPEPIRESIDPAPLVFAVLRWSNAGAPDEDRFAFRSPWLAWQAARRLLEARRV
jgi:hypothetical protein